MLTDKSCREAPINESESPQVGPQESDCSGTASERWWLMNAIQDTTFGKALDSHRIEVTGWTALAFLTATSPAELGGNWRPAINQVLVRQEWIRIERPIDATSSQPTFGFHLDVLAGTDYSFILQRGFLDDQLLNSRGNQNLYGIDLPQFYVNAYFPNLFAGTEFRAGRVFNPWGYESVEEWSTPLLTRSFTFINSPYTFMALGLYPTFNSAWSGVLLLANGNDTFFGPAEEPRFVGKLTWKSSDQRNTLALGTTAGRGRFNANEPFSSPTPGLPNEPAGHNNANMIDVVYTHQFDSSFSYAFESSYGVQHAVPANVPGGIVRPGAAVGTAHWASAVNYFRYAYNPRVGGIVRVELFDDIDGQRTGSPGLYTLITGGIQWRPTRALLIRPEIRYIENDTNRAFSGHHSVLTAGGDVIVRW
jgi:hypothetical protein